MKYRNKIFAALVACLLLIGCSQQTKEINQSEEINNENKTSVVNGITENANNGKLIYVMSDITGNVEKVMVSDEIKEIVKNSQNDKNEFLLTDIDGNNLHYSGNYEKAVPVGIHVTYYLNGNKVTENELNGANGHLKMEISYSNSTVDLAKKTCVPFAMISGVLIDGDHFKNIEVSNAKIIENENQNIIVGIGLPGINDCFDLDRDENTIIEAEVNDFNLEGIYCISAPLDLSNMDTSDIEDKLNELYDSMNQLQDAMSQLKDGSKQLYDGSTTLLNGSNELSNGLNKISANSSTLNNGAKQVFDSLLATATSTIRNAGLVIPDLTIGNYPTVLKNTITSLDKDNVYKLAHDQVRNVIETNYKDQIVRGVTQTVYANVRMQVAEIVNAQYEAGIREAVTAQVEQNTETIKMGVTAAVKENVKAEVKKAVLEANGIDDDTYNALDEQAKQAIDAAIDQNTDAKMSTEDIQALINEQTEAQRNQMIEQNVSAQMANKQDEINSVIDANTEAKMKEDDIQAIINENIEAQIEAQTENYIANDPEIQAKFAAAESGITQLQSALAQLNSYNEFYVGVKTYTDAVDTAANGAKKLAQGANDLRNGINELKEGIEKFDQEGIQKLINTVNDDLKPVQNRFDQIKGLSGGFRPFADTTHEIDNDVKYIFYLK